MMIGSRELPPESVLSSSMPDGPGMVASPGLLNKWVAMATQPVGTHGSYEVYTQSINFHYK